MITGFKQIILGGILVGSFSIGSFAQKLEAPVEVKVAPNNWYQLDRATTGYYGISLDKAYDFLKGKKSKTVVVAVIDSGIDTLQEDLKPILWVNKGEIPNNGIDDDNNGYVDDVHGWNFLGNKDGTNVKEDSDEGARVYWKLKEKYGNNLPDTNKLTGKDRIEAVTFYKAKNHVFDQGDPAELLMIRRMLPDLEIGDSIIGKDLGKTEFTGNDLKSYTTNNMLARRAAGMYLGMAEANNNNYDISNKDILEFFKGKVKKADNALAAPPDYRGMIIKDNYNDINDRFYGNTDLMTGSPMHGTHCSGIIGAVRNNGIGINGIADNVRIMMVRAVPGGDEHDKDIALAIRYAVDNGAQVISMSFGKGFSPQKEWVDDAVKYAESKGVLMVHAAGNDAENVDTTDNFPSPIFNNGEKATNYITVGASGDATNGGFTASFSNYGKHTVDVFAPGVNIYSTLPGGDKYGNASGTSMAGPVVAGVSALILEYFPTLTAEQIKYVIMKSAVPVKEKVILPGTQKPGPGEESVMVNLSDISVSGGELNAYEAVKLASTLKGDRKDLSLPKDKLMEKKRG